MSTYNTGNPLGSTSVKDLYDNAQGLDRATNDCVNKQWTDRFGKPRKTWWGMESDFQEFLLNSGFEIIGDYGAGLNITAFNQIFRKDGEFYRLSAEIDIPYTTNGNWTEENNRFVSVGDAVLRSELSAVNGAVRVGFIQNGDGAVGRTMLYKARETVSADDFDDGSKNGSAVQHAVNYLKSIGGGTLNVKGTWKFKGLMCLDLCPNLRLIGNGDTVFDFSNRSGSYAELYRYLMDVRGSFDPAIQLISDVSAGSWVINASTSNIREGDLIILTSDATQSGDSYEVNIGEYLIVDEILSPSSFRANNATFDNYAISDNARIHVVHPVENITIEGIKFIGQGRVDPKDGDIGLGFTYCRNVRVRDCSFYYIDQIQLELRSCYDWRVDGCYFHHTKYTSGSHTPGINQPIAIADRGPVQYQIRISDCSQYGVVSNCVGDGSRHMFNTGHSYRAENGSPQRQIGYLFGLIRRVKVVNCYAKNTWHASFSTHNDSEYIDFEGCVAENSGMAGFNPRHRNARFINCETRYCNVGFYLSMLPKNILLRGCRAIAGNSAISIAGVYQGDDFIIEDCIFEGPNYGLVFNPDAGNKGNLIFRNNIIKNAVNPAVGAYRPLRVLGEWDSVRIIGNVIDSTAASECINVDATTELVVVDGNKLSNGKRPIQISSLAEKSIITNNVSSNLSINQNYESSSPIVIKNNNVGLDNNGALTGSFSLSVVLENNAATSFSTHDNSNFFSISLTGSSYYGLVWGRASSSPVIVKIAGGTSFYVANTSLDGETGVVGAITFGAGNDAFYVENRTGSSQTITVTKL